MESSIWKINHFYELQGIRKDKAYEKIYHKKTENHSSSICRKENNKNSNVKTVSIMLKNKQNYTVYIYPKRRSKNVVPENMREDTCTSDAWRRSVSETRIKSKAIEMIHNGTPFNTNFFVHAAPKYQILRYPFSNTFCKIYRCQINTQEETCCCACNSDAMFEVMKSLYDCYKKKNCDHCNCILCGHLPREERRLGELRKAGKKMVSTKLGPGKLEGVVTPSKGKLLQKKEKQIIDKGRAEAGIRSASKTISAEKAIITPSARRISELKVPSEKLRKAQAAGLLTPLEGKKTEEKEKILKELAVQRIPLPVAKTTSEKKIIDKIRAEQGLPPEPKSKSEKAVITKIKASEKPPSELKVPSEKLRKAQAAGLLTPLEGKKTEEKEKILKELAVQKLPLPVAKTTSEKKIIDKIRAEHGLPPERKSSIDIKYDKAIKAGLISPPKGKAIQPSPSEKKKIIEGLAEGKIKPEKAVIAKTKVSEKLLVEKVTPSAKPISELKIPSEKLRKAQAAGLLSPLEGKKPEEKEKILKELAVQKLPLPVAKTISEKKIIDKIRAEHGLPPEPKTSAFAKYDKAVKAGTIGPPKGKIIQPTPSEKKKLLEVQAEGPPKSEKSVIAKIKTSEKPLIEKVRASIRATSELKVPSEKLRKAQAAGLLTPLEGKKPEEKEKILKELAVQKLPLPVAKTTSEKKIIDKIRAEHGLPPEPKSKSEKAVIAKIKASEKPLIEKTRASIKPPSELKVPSEKLRKAQAAGLLTPLEGKKTEEKEKILKELAVQKLPLPVAKTTSEKKIIDKIRAEHGLPPERKSSIDIKYDKAIKAGLISPPKGKAIQPSPSEKKKIIEGLAEGKIKPEKAVIAKTKVSEKLLVEKVTPSAKPISELKIPSEKLRKAQAAGLLTPLEGKKTEEKEKILKELAVQKLPLPVAKTTSEKKIIDKIRAEHGLPPEPKTSAYAKYDKAVKAGTIGPPKAASIKKTSELKVPSEKLRKAQAAGLLTPLEGKKTEEKEKILKELAVQKLPLPVAKTTSEKKIIDKIRAEHGLPPERKKPSETKYDKLIKAGIRVSPSVSIPSVRIRKAEAEGILTPLEGKTQKRKKEILQKLAEAGIPLPEGKTLSEKSLVRKIKTPLGVPPKTTTLSEKEITKIAKAAEGLLTPLKGKTASQKIKILKGLAESGEPMPEGTTASEKALIKKVRKDVGLTAELTPSEKKEKIRTKSKKIGIPTSRKSAKAGITEEFQDIIKTTTCDRGCGCDKKKIRFKHSYVKIRVTSPDISSLCPCPNECIPGVKGGVFTDNEGIKVTVGRIEGITPFYSTEYFSLTKVASSQSSLFKHNMISTDQHTKKYSHEDTELEEIKSGEHIFTVSKHCSAIISKSFKEMVPYNGSKVILKPQYLDETKLNNHKNESYGNLNNVNEVIFINTNIESYKPISSKPSIHDLYANSYTSNSSLKSLFLTGTDSSLSNSTRSFEIASTSISCMSLYSSNYSLTSFLSDTEDRSLVDLSTYHEDKIECDNYTETVSINSTTRSLSEICCLYEYSTNNLDEESEVTYSQSSYNSIEDFYRDLCILRLTPFEILETDFHENRNKGEISEEPIGEPFININESSSENTINHIINQLILTRSIASSSLILIIPDAHHDMRKTKSDDFSSSICIQISEDFSNRKNIETLSHNNQRTRVNIEAEDIKMFTKRKQSPREELSKLPIQNLLRTDVTKNCKYVKPTKKTQKCETIFRTISVDTTQDRPCCCSSKNRNSHQDDQCADNALSELLTPMTILKEAAAKGGNKQRFFITMDKNTTACPSSSSSSLNGSRHLITSIKMCKFSQCDGKISYHQMKEELLEPLDPEPCDCTMNKKKKLHNFEKKMTSTQCGKNIEIGTREKLLETKESKTNIVKQNPNVSCECNVNKQKKTNKPEKKMVSKQIGEMSEIDNPYCGGCCCRNIPPANNEKCKVVKMESQSCDDCVTKVKISIGCQCCPCKDADTSTDSTHHIHKDKKVGKKSDKKKQITCECPEPRPYENLNFEEDEMSFEDAIEYFKDHPLVDSEIDKNMCCCENKPPRKKLVECDCPPCPMEPEIIEPFQGFKLHVEAKGSSSKGLSGICCFDLIQI